MKSFLKFCVLLMICGLYSTHLYALNREDIILTDGATISNTELNIKGANLIEKYLVSYSKELQDFEVIYGLQNDKIIDASLKEIEKLIFILRKIQTDKVEKSVAEEAMKHSISQIKGINKTLKLYLKNRAEQVKEETNQLKTKYTNALGPFSIKLDQIISKFIRELKKKTIISQEDKLMLEHLRNLESENLKIKNFKNINFKNPAEISSSLKRIIKNVQIEMKEIKLLLK